MTSLYEQPVRITYYDLDREGRFKLSALLRLAHIAADINANALGCGFNDLFPLSMSFVLQRFGLETKRLPEYDETVTVRTWPSDISKGTFLRKGNILDTSGNTLMEWTSLWVLLDLKARRILRPNALPKPLEGIGAQGVGAEALKVDVSEDWGEEFSAHVHTVRYSEVDTNKHMNNTFYGDLIADALHKNTGAEITPVFHHTQINYLSEVKQNEDIRVRCRREGGKFRVTGAAGERTAFSALLQ
ncbi:MAG: hypothetical protein LBR83_09395 [Clostridiales bacterium]|jgi:acyl-ACP thioesterase|nr:hypothetical protein [Clostridiales bacterium]